MEYVTFNDEHLQSHILRKSKIRREEFDPTNREHLVSYKTFLDTGNWGKVQFFCEFPYVTVPETISRKFADFAINKMLSKIKME